MTDEKNLLDEVLTSNPAAAARRPTPPGAYKMVLRAYRDGQNPTNGNRNFELTFGLLESNGDQDLEGVDLSRAQAYATMWVTENTIASGITQRWLTELGAWEEGSTVRQMIEAAVGNKMDGVVEFRKKDVTDGKPFPRLDVAKIGDFDVQGRNMKIAA